MASTVTYTPMIQHYLSVKEQYPDALVFYRIGDFYELFFEDAKTASRELDLVLTGKNAGAPERVPMCGVPHHAVESYIARLVQRGYKVVIVKQMQDPKEAVGLVERDVVRVITPGTVMSEITDEKQDVYLAAIADYGYGYCLALAEMSTGENFLTSCGHDRTDLSQTLLRQTVREIVVSESFDKRILQALKTMQIVISYEEETAIKEDYLPLCEILQKDYEREAYGRMLQYLEATQKHLLSHLQPLQRLREDAFLRMDYTTMQNLELTVSLNRQGSQETLWSFLDTCRSAMGSRLLRRWIEQPLVDVQAITARQDRIAWLLKNFLKRRSLRDALGGIYDLQRLIARCAMGTASPVDCLRLSRTLEQVPKILQNIQSEEFAAYTALDSCADLAALLKKALVDDPPVLTSEGGIFRSGYDADLDEARTIQNNGRDFILNYEAQEKERTGLKTLKIGYNKVFGYYIEISKAAAQQVKPEWGYIRKQTLVNNERFISPELKEKEDAILHAQEKAVGLEKQLYGQLLQRIQQDLPQLQKLAAALSEIDCYAALAEDAARYGYTRPVFTDGEMNVKSGRHPILDARMKDPRYVANDIHLDDQQNILLITGPNMGGKSTYMRQNALLVIMAQMGSYVPAKECRLPVFDRIFTRIGASDDILAGQSTFMVEMTEANNALQHATKNSLILFDEIGRGTSTYDGMALAQAMIEYIASCIHCKTLFSTHYHELTSLADTVDGIRNVHAAVKEEADQVTFLYRIKDGPADRSYGINVARLAGLPEAVLSRAKDLQKQLESKRRVVQQSYQLVEMKKEDPQESAILKELREVSPDDLSPRQAWDMLSDLHEQAGKKEK